MATDREELLLLRIQDSDVAERLNAVLLEKPDAPKDPVVELRFDGEGLSTYFFMPRCINAQASVLWACL